LSDGLLCTLRSLHQKSGDPTATECGCGGLCAAKKSILALSGHGTARWLVPSSRHLLVDHDGIAGNRVLDNLRAHLVRESEL
jgi:hypothetical protein